MANDWGGLEALLAAAEYVESRDQQENNQNQKLIEICEEYPSSEKSYLTESTTSPTSNAAVVIPSTPTPPTAVSVVAKNIPAQSASFKAAVYVPQSGLRAATPGSHSGVISSTVSSLTASSLLTNGSSSSPSVPFSTLPSFSPSPSLTFTFTTPTLASQTAASLLKISHPPVRLPNAAASPRQLPTVMATVTTTTTPPPSLVIQRTAAATVAYSPSPPPPLPSTTRILPPPPMPPIQQQQQPPLAHPNSMSTISILPQRTYVERPGATDTKRKLSNSGTREVHNKLEKNRRAHLKECFELLKSQVPAIQDEKKPSNLTILRTAIRYVQILRRREQDLITERDRLKSDNIVNQQRLTSLKKELTAQWDHIDFNSLLPDTVELKQTTSDNDVDQRKDLENDGEVEKIAMSDLDDSSSQIKSKGGGTYYGSSSSIGSCSISPSLNISSPNIVSTTSDVPLPPQIHIVESTSVPSFDKLSSSSAVSPLQFLSTSTIRMIADPEQPIALVQHNGGERSLDSSTGATLSKVAVHTGNNTFTIFSDSLHKAAAATTSTTTTTTTMTMITETLTAAAAAAAASTSNTTKLTVPPSTAMQLTHGVSVPTTPMNRKNIALPVKSIFSSSTPPNGTVTTSTSIIGDRPSNAVLTTVPMSSATHATVRNHSFVVTPHLSTNVLKTVSRLQPINGHHQLVVKPTTMVVVSSSTAAAASK